VCKKPSVTHGFGAKLVPSWSAPAFASKRILLGLLLNLNAVAQVAHNRRLVMGRLVPAALKAALWRRAVASIDDPGIAPTHDSRYNLAASAVRP